MLRANKGEWSEVYVLIKLLSDKKMFAGDEYLNKIENLFFPIVKIIRSKSIEYKVSDNEIEIINNGNSYKLPVEIFKNKAIELFKEINSGSGAFAILSIEQFMNEISVAKIKANSDSKSDIDVAIHDLRTCSDHLLGFSIKSQLGSASTLLNASKTTNFIFDVKGLAEDIDTIIAKTDKMVNIRERLEFISSQKTIISFNHLSNDIFHNNLTVVDTAMTDIMAEMVKLYYSTRYTSVKDLTAELTRNNPLGFNLSYSHSHYETKIKRLLVDIALGMMPSKVWTAKYEATGGYLVVKKDGDVLCYHIYEKNKFEDYLFNNTKFETASTERHEFGRFYKDENKLHIKLNLQIRFK